MPPRARRRGWIEPLPNGSYRAWVHAGTDPLTGRPDRRHDTHETYGETDRTTNLS